MKLRIYTFLIGGVLLLCSAKAQENFTFENLLRDTVHLVVDPNDIGSHYLGQDIALKYQRLKETYTYVEAGSDASPQSRTVVDKPNIYYSLKKLNTYFKKQLKKGEIDSSLAVEKLGWYFDIGFAIYEQNTSDFEDALKAAKKPDEIAEVFAQVILE